jgi:poly(3-hydroxybutyrate) depolymerase
MGRIRRVLRTRSSARTIGLAAGAALSILLGGQTASAKVIDESADLAGMTLHYRVVLPKNYAPEKTYPAVLAFPPGAQTMDMVFTTLERNWAPEAQRRGYIVVIPAAPGGRLFIEDGARVFPAFLDKLLGDYKIRDRKFYIAGMSNGGLSAFHIAASFPQYFLAVSGFPGYLPDATPERVKALANLCINMHVGELDTGWRKSMEAQAAEFRDQGFVVHITVEKGQSHVIGTLTGEGSARLFQEMEACSK